MRIGGLTALYNSRPKFCVGLRSDLWLSHSRTLTLLSLNHFCVAFTVCFWSLSCWKIHLLPSCSSLSDWTRLFSRNSLLPHSFYPPPTPSRACCSATPHHDAATTMLHSEDGVFEVMFSVWCLLNFGSRLMAQKLNVGLFGSKNLLPADLGSPSCLWMNFGQDLMSFLQQWLSLCLSPIKLWLVRNPGKSCCMKSHSLLPEYS